MLPIVLGGIGLGMIGLPLSLALIASVDADRIGPASAVSVMLRSLGGPLVLGFVQIAITVAHAAPRWHHRAGEGHE